MLTVIALSAVLMQEPPAPPAPSEVHTRVMVMGAGGLDKDGDGQVSREEFAAPLNDHFGQMDKNGDGRLSTEELTAGQGAMGGDHDVIIRRGPGGPEGHRFPMRRHPGGEDGVHAEHAGDGERRVMVFSGGPSGPGGEREIVIHGGPGERIETRRRGGPGGEHGGGHDLDADNDGRISEAEFSAPLREAFARVDADRSGFIEAGERGQGNGSEVFVHRFEMRQNGED